ncbi:hypothetical protein [Desulfopila aestuarii]|uniref:Uncharacterized protein n=1 Tax=Desulfopila aestuarii DSM 18488 TaxID=1121416 RepID=A0A1M7YEN2_9BACT|nr:hypothetical protein [Desulfopila aestuarii]SHO51104.1 hypothetical protein SAMN02745220_03841 [Desulfopila aestuarii DSM 18488]
MKDNIPDREMLSQEILASFTVESDNHELKTILVVQDIHQFYQKDKTYRKTYRLGSLEGECVYLTGDPNVFKLETGAILKRKSR